MKHTLTIIMLCIATATQAQMEPELRKRADKYFERNIDPITRAESYTSKIKFGATSNVIPWMYIDTSGSWIMSFIYTGNQWLFADKLTCRINNEVYTYTFPSAHIQRNTAPGSVQETLSLYPKPDGEKLLQLMANSSGNQLYRLSGERVKDFEFTKQQAEMLRTAWDLITYLHEKR